MYTLAALGFPQTSFGVRSSHIHFSRVIYFKPIWWGRGGGGLFERGGLFTLERTMVSVLHKEVEYEVEKLKYKKF